MKKKSLLAIAGLLIFIAGVAVGYEYKTYEIRKIFTETEEQIQEVFGGGETVEQNTTDSSKTEFQQMLEEKEILETNIGSVLELATVNVTVKSVEEKDIFNRDYSDPLVARENAKFIIVGMDVENTTSEAFNFSGGEVSLVDAQGREYLPSSELYSSDGSLVYRDIMPNLKESGILLYEVPEDSKNYSVFLGKAGTNIVYKVVLK